MPGPRLAAHATFAERVVEAGDRPGFRILEIGSREVTGSYRLRDRLAHAEYVGFDYYPGPNVDVAGDAHRLSQLVAGRFDVVYSTAVFEHLAMPWVVAEEIARVLKPGGMVFIETHFSYSSHERPWHFFQFSDMGLRALFSPALGFECVEAAMQNPIVGRFSYFAEWTDSGGATSRWRRSSARPGIRRPPSAGLLQSGAPKIAGELNRRFKQTIDLSITHECMKLFQLDCCESAIC